MFAKLPPLLAGKQVPFAAKTFLSMSRGKEFAGNVGALQGKGTSPSSEGTQLLRTDRQTLHCNPAECNSLGHVGTIPLLPFR